MNEWQARYKALLAGISDQTIIANAERLIEIAIKMSRESALTFDEVFYALLTVAGMLKGQPRIRRPDDDKQWTEVYQMLFDEFLKPDTESPK